MYTKLKAGLTASSNHSAAHIAFLEHFAYKRAYSTPIKSVQCKTRLLVLQIIKLHGGFSKSLFSLFPLTRGQIFMLYLFAILNNFNNSNGT